MEVRNHPKTFKMKNPQKKTYQTQPLLRQGLRQTQITDFLFLLPQMPETPGIWVYCLFFFFCLLSEQLNLERSAYPFGKNLFL